MSEIIYNRRAAISNSILYGVFLVLAILGLLTRSSRLGYLLMGLVVVWVIGGFMANMRAVQHGFRPDD